MSTEKASSLAVNLPVPLDDDDEDADYWQHHIDSWMQSGLTQVSYCRRHHLDYKKFCKWKGRLKSYPTSGCSIKLVEVKRDFKLKGNVQSPLFGCDPGGRDRSRNRSSAGACYNYVNNMPMGAGSVGSPGINGVGHSSGIRFWCGQFCIEIDVQFCSESLSQLIETLQRLEGLRLQMANAANEESAEIAESE